MSSEFRAFQPIQGATVSASTTNPTSGNVAMGTAPAAGSTVGSAPQILVYNSGTVAVAVNFGPTTGAAVAVIPNGATPGDMVIAAGASRIISAPASTAFCAAIALATGTCVVYFTPGTGLP